MERRLAAILAADVVGYTRLMGADETRTLRHLTELRQDVLQPLIAEHRGRIVKLIGDGFLVEFASVVDALTCAIAWQSRTHDREATADEAQRFQFRIGINLGDVIVEGEDIHGDGVNIAARLEGIAEPGGIWLSEDAYRQVRGKTEAHFEDMGARDLKNVAEQLRVYRVARMAPCAASAKSNTQPLPLPDKPSIAVLPFNNMSGDPEQEYFADGVVEEIITALSRMRWLFVIARNSTFTYKGRAENVKQIGLELGVRYVLEGSVRKAGNRVRITGQLIDAATGAHLWADRFDGNLEDVFDLQDKVTSSVVGAIAPKLEQAEIERAKRKPTESLDAYDYFLRGLSCVHRWNREANEDALKHFSRAIQLDPDFAAAHGMKARCYSQRKVSGWVVDRQQEVADAERMARRAAMLGKDDAVALNAAGMALAYVVGELEDGAALIDQALVLDPNLAWAWLFSGWVNIWLGNPEVSIERVARAMRLSPHDPHVYNMHAALASAHYSAGRYSEASEWAETAAREQPNHLIATSIVAASGAFGGRLAEAHKAMARLRELMPSLRASNINDLVTYRRPEDLARLVEGLRIAGLPE